MNEFLTYQYQQSLRILDGQDIGDSNIDDQLCFKDIFNDNKLFGIILCIFVAIFIIFFILLFYFWVKRRLWFPMQERSTYCTLFFLIACSINFFIQPLLLIIYNSSDEAVYTVDGQLEKVFKFFYIFSRFSLTTIYIAKASRLSFAFSVKQIANALYKFFKNEYLVLLSATLVSLSISLALIFSNEYVNIVLSIEYGYADHAEQFWVPVQCIEAMIYCTLLLMMQNVSPYYKVSQEIACMFFSNFVLSVVQYSLYAKNYDAPNYCRTGTDIFTYLVFAITQLRTLFNVIFCVYIPLYKAKKIPIPLPNQKALIDTVEHTDSILQFCYVFTIFNKELREPFCKFLKYMDEQIEKQTPEGQYLLHRIDIQAKKHPLIKHIQSFSQLFEYYEDVSIAIEIGNQKKMELVVSQYIFQQDVYLHTIIQNENNQTNNNINNNNTHQFFRSDNNSNIISVSNQDVTNNTFTHNPMLQRINNYKKEESKWKKCFQCCFKNKNNINKRDIFQLEEGTYQKVIESFFHHQDNNKQSLELKEALKEVQDKLFQYIHVIWKHFFYPTQSFAYLRDLFMHYGSVRNHLQEFNLTNQEYQSEENQSSTPTPQRSFD